MTCPVLTGALIENSRWVSCPDGGSDREQSVGELSWPDGGSDREQSVGEFSWPKGTSDREQSVGQLSLTISWPDGGSCLWLKSNLSSLAPESCSKNGQLRTKLSCCCCCCFFCFLSL